MILAGIFTKKACSLESAACLWEPQSFNCLRHILPFSYKITASFIWILWCAKLQLIALCYHPHTHSSKHTLLFMCLYKIMNLRLNTDTTWGHQIILKGHIIWMFLSRYDEQKIRQVLRFCQNGFYHYYQCNTVRWSTYFTR